MNPGGIRNKTGFFVSVALSVVVAAGGSAKGEAPYNGDPDPDRPTLHVQPPVLGSPNVAPFAPQVSGVINGIFFIDVMLSAGFNLAGYDVGNEPAVAANPLNTNQIVLTSFSGSDWPTGGNSTIWYSGDGGNSWVYSASVPPPPGTSTAIRCPCDQTMDWGRDGILRGTFLHLGIGGLPQTVFSAQATTPTSPASWTYRTSSGVAQKTSRSDLSYVDQPWISGGPLPADNSQMNVCVAYDNFDAGFSFAEIRDADSQAASPLNFTFDAAANGDGQVLGDGMNPGNRNAIGPNGLIFNLFQRYEASLAGGVKQLTYLLSVSSDGGQSWSVANSDHGSGAKIVAGSVYSFQGNGSKVGGVNALLGGVDAITVDPVTGTAWIVYGSRATTVSNDRLFLVPAAYSGGNLTIGTARQISPAGINAYLPGVAVLPSGEVGVLFLTWDGANFGYNFIQTTDGGATIAKTTTLTAFTSPFASTAMTNQRILGDYLQARSVGCSFYGTYPARGTGTNTVNSIVPYFMKAPAATACSLPALTSIVPGAVCAGSGAFTLTLNGSNFLNPGNGRVQAMLRSTTLMSSNQVLVSVPSGDVASPGARSVDYLGAAPAGGLTASLPLAVETPAGSPGNSLRVAKGGGNVLLSWSATAGATSYRVKRCGAAAPCTPSPVASPATNGYADPVLADGNDYWYLIEAANSCGAVP